MSFDFKYKLWLESKKDLKNLIKRQNILKRKNPVEDSNITIQILSQLYILYSALVEKLSFLYRETFQVQKKEVIRNLAQPAIKRLLELKNKLKEFELSDYVYSDRYLIERKLTPYDLLIWRSWLEYSRPLEIQTVLLENQYSTKKTSEEIVHAITIIQSHERARKARLLRSELEYNTFNLQQNIAEKVPYTFTHKSDVLVLIPIKRTIFRSNFIKSSNMCQKALCSENLQEAEATGGDYNATEKMTNSALIIQDAWRNYNAKKRLKMKFNIKQSLYGMRKTKKLLNPEEYEYNISEEYRKCLKQRNLDNNYKQLIDSERVRLLKEYAPQIMEDISDHIREWFKEFYEKTGDFHPYPEAFKSGTVLLLTDETMSLEEFKEYQKVQALSKDQRKALNEKLKLEKQKKKDKRKAEKLKDMKLKKRLREEGTYDLGNELRNNKNIAKLEATIAQYSNDWKHIDEYLNKQHDAIKEWVTESQLAVIHKELRILVDKFMRIEYELLKQAWSVDNKKPYKQSRTKEKDKKKRKKRKPHDLSADRTIESLYHELRTLQIIDNYPVRTFEDYFGDFNLMADDFRDEDNLVSLNPAKGDIKWAIQDILFGMGGFQVEKPKSLCLVGPPNNGKKLLAKIIASELGAVFIDLSPEKTFQFSDNLIYFIQVVLKVAKAFQPTIIFIDEAHRVFWKKTPKDQVHIQPTLLRSVLVKSILKSIGKKDKIMVLGTSSLPWSATPRFKKVFQHKLLVPESDYGTIFLMWLELLTQNVSSNYYEDSILSTLAKVFQKYNTGDIADNVANSINVERRLRLHSEPINPNEFLDYFVSLSNPLFPPNEKSLEKYNEWYKTSNKYVKLRKWRESKRRKKK